MTKLTTPMLATLTTLALTSGVALAGSEDVVVDDAWARASIGVNRPGAAYMTIRNNGDEAVTLTGISTPLAMMPEIHESKTNAEGVSSMAPAGEITIAPGEAAELANLAGKMISSAKVQVEYYALRKESPRIEWLESPNALK